MDYILYDLEMNNESNKNIRQNVKSAYEIIQIGAVKLRMENESLKIVDKFSCLVKPFQLTKISPFITKLTGIKQEDVEAAPSLEEVLPNFKQFVGEGSLLISWGLQDKKMLYKACKRVGIDDLWFKDAHVDIQKQVSRMYCEPGALISLAKALIKLQLTPTGESHDAYFDAENTAKIFINLFGQLDLSDCLSKETKNKMTLKTTQEAV